MRTIAAEMVEARPAGVFLMTQSNAGLPKLVGDEFIYDGSPQVMADWAAEMRELGIDVIGACCGSTPEHIAAMRDIVLA
jgi:5-methyltetrahydrofolate--homocysteine methyltransferase